MQAEVRKKFDGYPEKIQPLMYQLRALVLDVAEKGGLGEVDETLKWGEPSYGVKGGSPVRMDWKPKDPEHYCLFFHCQTKLVDTFRELYAHVLTFEGNRAIVLDVRKPLPKAAIQDCVDLALRYQSIKHLPFLGR